MSPEIREGSGGHPGCPLGVGRASRKSLRGRKCPWISGMGWEAPRGFGRGQEELPDVWDGLGAPPEIQEGSRGPQNFGRGWECPRSPEGVGRDPRTSGGVERAPRKFGRGQEGPPEDR